VVALISGYFLYLSPKLAALADAKKQEASLIQNYEIKAFQGANLPAYQQQMREIKSEISSLTAQLPIKKSIPELIEQIGESAKQNRVDIRGLKLQPEQRLEAYNTQPITLTVNGSYHNLGFFLAALTQLKRIVTLHDFTLEPGQQQLTLKIQATAYHNTPDETAEQGAAND